MSQKTRVLPLMEAVEERTLLATFTVTTTADSGPGSFRDAIIKANKKSDADVIKFAIGSGQKTIAPSSGLPFVMYPVTIDGTTQPGYSSKPLIEIRGDKTWGDGLRIGGGNSTVKGLIINRFSGNGMILVNKGGNTIKGNWIGLDKTGTSAAKNGKKGIVVSTSNNTVGGTTAKDRNVVSGNGSDGVQMWSSASYSNVVIGNYIGTDHTGEKAIGNAAVGVSINSAGKNRVGGTASGERNVVSGNRTNGFVVNGSGAKENKIIGNYVGLNAAGTKAIANQSYGIEISRENNVVQKNVVSGNVKSGVVLWLSSAYGNKINGNLIGTDKNGSYAIGNGWKGIEVTNGAKNNTIGGTTSADRNIVSGNKSHGIQVFQGSGNKFYNNYVGVGLNGTTKLGNNGSGFHLIATSNTLISGGIIGYNSPYGINNGQSSKTVVTGVKLISNTLYKVKLV